jgi:hypothetical protein
MWSKKIRQFAEHGALVELKDQAVRPSGRIAKPRISVARITQLRQSLTVSYHRHPADSTENNRKDLHSFVWEFRVQIERS